MKKKKKKVCTLILSFFESQILLKLKLIFEKLDFEVKFLVIDHSTHHLKQIKLLKKARFVFFSPWKETGEKQEDKDGKEE